MKTSTEWVGVSLFQGFVIIKLMRATLIKALFHILAIIMALTAVGYELRDGTAGNWPASANGSLSVALLLGRLTELCQLPVGPHAYFGMLMIFLPLH